MGWLSRLLGADDRKPTTGFPVQSPPPCDYEDDGDSWYVPAGKDESRFVGPDGMPTLRLIKYRDSGAENVLRLCEDSTGLLVGPSDVRLPKIGIYVSQLRGEYYHQAACKAGNFAPGSPVRLVPEPTNEHDPHAVAVYDARGRNLAAYLNKQKARQVGKLLAAGEQLEAISVRGTGAGTPCEQIAVLAARPAILRRLLDPRPSHLPKPAHLR
jgi:hypothetical protein